MNNKPDFVKVISKALKEITASLEPIRTNLEYNRYEVKLDLCVLCAYLKSHDYIDFIINRSEPRDSYFYFPGLRSICEDLIVLSYLLKFERKDAESYFISKQFMEIEKSIMAQKKYFEKFNTRQKVVPQVKSIDEMIDSQNIALGRTDLVKMRLPNTLQMAKVIGQEDIYNFIYHATSKSVHFDITSLFRTAWGELDLNKDLINVNIRHDHDYSYRNIYSFIVFYSIKVFHEQSKAFKEALSLPIELIHLLHIIVAKFETSNKEWPPIISFEEMNLRNPNR